MDTKERKAEVRNGPKTRSGAHAEPESGVRHTALAAKIDLKKGSMISRGMIGKFCSLRLRRFDPGWQTGSGGLSEGEARQLGSSLVTQPKETRAVLG